MEVKNWTNELWEEAEPSDQRHCCFQCANSNSRLIYLGDEYEHMCYECLYKWIEKISNENKKK